MENVYLFSRTKKLHHAQNPDVSNELAGEGADMRQGEESGATQSFGATAGKLAVGAGFGVLKMVRHIVFVALAWLRIPISLLCQVITAGCFIALALGFFIAPDKHQMLWLMAGMGFASFAFLWVYDMVLMWLSPVDTFMSL
jgi:hypothetical protein